MLDVSIGWLVCSFAWIAAETGPENVARWIWPTSQVEDYQEALFRKRFTLGARPVRATLRGACDDRTNVYLNGELVAASPSWWSPYEQTDNVMEVLREGENVFAAWGQNETMRAGFWLELTIETADGAHTSIVTDESWSVSSEEHEDFEAPDFDDSRWSQAVSLGELGGPPWGPPDDPTPFEPSEALAAEEIALAPGFRAELVYTVPRIRQGSWVSLTSDERGRLYASDQYGSLYRIVPPALGTSTGVAVERIEIDLGEAQGLAWANGALYVVVNGHGDYESGLWRASDRDGDDLLDTAELLEPIEGSGEHGPHAVRVAPDGGSLYVIAGNFTALPEHVTKSRVTRAWGEDQLLPRLDDPNGHDVGILAPGAWLCRTDFDGGEWELVASGMRNPYDFDFDPSGEVFTFDADMEWDTGLPWYRPTRVVHMVSGAEFGWRNGSGKWPPHYPDSLPAVVDVGLSSPTGVEFGTRARFPERWRRARYVCDWADGTLYAVHLDPAGASFTGTFEVFARGKPFPITDACVAPDGAMYVTTGGRQTQSALYRITALEPEEPDVADAPLESAEIRAAREVRKELEAAHGRSAPEIVPVALVRLGDPDRFVRWAARVALEQQSIGSWAELALALAEPRARVEAIVALARVAPASLRERLIASFRALPLEAMPADDLAAALRALELVLIRMGAPSEPLALVTQLDGLFPTGESRVDRGLCQLLAWLEAGEVTDTIEKTLERIESGIPQEDRLHLAACLRVVERGWTEPSRRRYFAFLDDALAGFDGGHGFGQFVDRIREDALERMPREARDELEAWLAARRAARPERRDLGSATLEVSMPVPREREWSAGELRILLASPLHGRSFERGRAIYESATCAQCHRLRAEGGSTGPDLTGAGSRFSRLDLLDAILEPSRVISDQYGDQELVTADDELLVGRIEREEGGSLHLRLLPPAEELIEVDAARIVERRAHPLSRMPAGLLDALTEEEIADLFAYVLSGGDATDRAFQVADR